MGFGHAYPWQIAARVMAVPLTCRLRRSFDRVRLREEVWHATHDHEGDLRESSALARMPYFARAIDALKCDKQRVRLVQLAPEAEIAWRCEEELDPELVRVHIPIATNRGVWMQIGYEDCDWKPGELWFGDFAFPHRVRNTSRETRIHLVLDLVVNPFVRGLFPADFEYARVDRERARRLCSSLYALYDAPSRAQTLLQGQLAELRSAPAKKPA